MYLKLSNCYYKKLNTYTNTQKNKIIDNFHYISDTFKCFKARILAKTFPLFPLKILREEADIGL